MASFLKRIGLSKLLKQFRNACRVLLGHRTKKEKELKGRLQKVKKKNEELRRDLTSAVTQSKTDPLTGLPNRAGFNERLAPMHQALVAINDERAEEAPLHLFMLHVDGDWFKKINDTLGHKGGDAALCYLADTISNALRHEEMGSRFSDVVARNPSLAGRLGGEEFVCFGVCQNEEEAMKIGERVRRAVEEGTFFYGGNVHKMTVSVGISSCVPGQETVGVDVVFQRGDAALYAAKNSGRNGCCQTTSEEGWFRKKDGTLVQKADPHKYVIINRDGSGYSVETVEDKPDSREKRVVRKEFRNFADEGITVPQSLRSSPGRNNVMPLVRTGLSTSTPK